MAQHHRAYRAFLRSRLIVLDPAATDKHDGCSRDGELTYKPTRILRGQGLQRAIDAIGSPGFDELGSFSWNKSLSLEQSKYSLSLSVYLAMTILLGTFFSPQHRTRHQSHW
jgi:hypothetical protein